MEIKVPTHINDIRLEEYQRFAKVNVEGADQEFLLHKTIEIFCELDLRIVSQMPVKTAEDLREEIDAVLNQEFPFTDRFEMDGVEYGFIPDMQEMTLGEFIDLEESLKDPSQLHKAAAVMFRPVTKSFRELYAVEAYNPTAEVHERMKNTPLGIVTAGVVFFYRIVNELLRVSPHFMNRLKEESRTILEKDSLPLNTDGSTASMLYLRAILQSTER